MNDQTLRGYLYPDTPASDVENEGFSSSITDDRVPGVLYVTRDEPIGYPKVITEHYGTVTNYIPLQPCVRIRNASDLSIAGNDANGQRRGLTIATDLPMYVEGCFNTDGMKNATYTIVGPGITPGYIDKPSALVAADAVTMLSCNWDDAWCLPNWNDWDGINLSSVRPTENLNTRVAAETTFIGIVMTGIVESNGNHYSGGLHNIFRFQENWQPSSILPFNFKGSIVCLWTSQIANKPIEGSYTYRPPSRPWSWAEMNPPGLPELMNCQEHELEQISVAEYGDADFF